MQHGRAGHVSLMLIGILCTVQTLMCNLGIWTGDPNGLDFAWPSELGMPEERTSKLLASLPKATSTGSSRSWRWTAVFLASVPKPVRLKLRMSWSAQVVARMEPSPLKAMPVRVSVCP